MHLLKRHVLISLNNDHQDLRIWWFGLVIQMITSFGPFLVGCGAPRDPVGVMDYYVIHYTKVITL